MRRKHLLAVLAAAVLGAFVVSLPSQALTLLANTAQWVNSSGSIKSASPDNPLPAGIYPVWGADQALTCNAAGSTRSSQLAAGTEGIIQCGSYKSWVDQGDSTITAEASTDRLLLPNGQMPFRVDNTTTQGYIAVVCTSLQICILSVDG